MREEILRVENVIREIEGITYLDNINFHIFKGEIMGLIPLNNHGKNQLIELICQNMPIDFGRIYFDEKLVNYYEHSNMSNNKVYFIDKQTKLVEDLKVTDNIYVLNHSFDNYMIQEKKLRAQADALLEYLHLHIQTNQLVSELSLFEKTVVELIKAVTNGAQLIILNELSNFLSIEELSSFHKLMIHYTQKGISFLYMANHHEEAFKICHRVCLFENGRVLKVIDQKDFADKTLDPYIIPFDHSAGLHESSEDTGILEFKNLQTENFKNISFSIGKGECITLLDINNKGIQDIAQILSGRITPQRGKILLRGKTVDTLDTTDLLLKGILFIPENPIDKLLFYDMSYLENLTFLMDRKLNKSILSKKIIKNIKAEYENILGEEIHAKDLNSLDKRALYNLVYFKIQLYHPKVVFIMQPFSNADMYLRGRIIKLINGLKKKGIAVIILAVSISDTLTVSDRFFVIEDGRLLKEPQKKHLER